MTKSVAIIGFGYVGKAMFNFFRDHYNIVIFDPYVSAIAHARSTKHEVFCTRTDFESVNKCDLVLICVPTPRADNGQCDTSIVVSYLDKIDKNKLVIIKSTVEIGTTDSLKEETGSRVVFCPEFCGESTYWSPYPFHTDVKETPWFVFGGDKKDTSEAVDWYMEVVGPTKQYIQTDAKTAEMAKYVENTFYATKITFCYEIANICEKFGIDYNEMRELWLLDPRLNRMHTSVFEKNDLPFSGKCLPKDLSALVFASKASGYDANLLQEVLDSNDRMGEYRKKKRNNKS